MLPAAVISSDRRALLRAAKPLTDFADQRITHADREPSQPPPTLNQLDAFIDHFGGLVQKYSLILNGSTLVDLIPTSQEDWKAPFRLAWLAPDSEA